MRQMRLIDPESLKVLRYLGSRLDQLSHGEHTVLAQKCQTSRSTITRLKEAAEDYHPDFDVVYRVLSKISGIPLFKIQGNELLSNLPRHANKGLLWKMEQEARELAEDDIELVLKFLAILKYREQIDPLYLTAAENTITLAHNQLIEKRGATILGQESKIEGNGRHREG